jgi:hypothetical protein
MILIHENYSGYVPARSIRGSAERLISSLPSGHLAGLQSLVLTNSAKLGVGKTKRIKGRKYREDACLGFYHEQTRKSAPWIEIVVDNIVGGTPAVLLRLRVFTDLVLADTVFHEVGHHLEKTIGAPSRVGEDAANAWRRILLRKYFRSRYPVISLLWRAVRRWLPRRAGS